MDVIFQEIIRLIYSEKVYFFIKLVSLKPKAIYCFGLFFFGSIVTFFVENIVVFVFRVKKDTFDYKIKRDEIYYYFNSTSYIVDELLKFFKSNQE